MERIITRRAFIGEVTAGLTVVACGVLKEFPEQGTNLGLSIDEAGFWKVVNGKPQFGIITQTFDKDKMDCLKPLGDFCVAEVSPNFKIGLNKPMIDFMFAQAKLTNPTLPTRMVFTEDWLEKSRGEDTGAYTAISDDGTNQIIVVSLKAAALEAFLDLERKKLPLEPYFNGAISFMVSRYAAHESAHAGVQTKKFLKKGESLIPDDLLEETHPQIFAFERRYIELFSQALEKNLGDNALLFVANLESGVNIQVYKAQIINEARALGMLYSIGG